LYRGYLYSSFSTDKDRWIKFEKMCIPRSTPQMNFLSVHCIGNPSYYAKNFDVKMTLLRLLDRGYLYSSFSTDKDRWIKFEKMCIPRSTPQMNFLSVHCIGNPSYYAKNFDVKMTLLRLLDRGYLYSSFSTDKDRCKILRDTIIYCNNICKILSYTKTAKIDVRCHEML